MMKSSKRIVFDRRSKICSKLFCIICNEFANCACHYTKMDKKTLYRVLVIISILFSCQIALYWNQVNDDIVYAIVAMLFNLSFFIHVPFIYLRIAAIIKKIYPNDSCMIYYSPVVLLLYFIISLAQGAIIDMQIINKWISSFSKLNGNVNLEYILLVTSLGSWSITLLLLISSIFFVPCIVYWNYIDVYKSVIRAEVLTSNNVNQLTELPVELSEIIISYGQD